MSPEPLHQRKFPTHTVGNGSRRGEHNQGCRFSKLSPRAKLYLTITSKRAPVEKKKDPRNNYFVCRAVKATKPADFRRTRVPEVGFRLFKARGRSRTKRIQILRTGLEAPFQLLIREGQKGSVVGGSTMTHLSEPVCCESIPPQRPTWARICTPLHRMSLLFSPLGLG